MSAKSSVLVVQCGLGEHVDRAAATAMADAGYNVETWDGERYSLSLLDRLKPLAILFQYAYPDLPGLTHLQMTRRHQPNLPVLMITEGHSEALAVWALRSRVWDYFVQPVDTTRLIEVLNQLSIPRLPGTDPAAMPNPIPAEARLRPARRSDDGPALDRVTAYVERHLAGRISQRDVASLCGLTPSQFSRAFKRRFGVTFQHYLIRLRLTEAMRLLGHPDASITDICYAVGFRDLSYFARTFRRYVGETPSQYRRQKGLKAPLTTARGRVLTGLPLIRSTTDELPGCPQTQAAASG